MEDLAYVVVALIILYVTYRWISVGGQTAQPAPSTTSTAASSSTNTAANLGFRPRTVTAEMVQTVASMFPDIPEDNIRYDLLRTGNTERTVNTLLEKGFLPPPPPSYIRPAGAQPSSSSRPPAGPVASTSSPSRPTSLISRFHLEDRLDDANLPANVGGKSKWEASAAEREASLAERKAQMVLAARRRLLAKQSREPSTL